MWFNRSISQESSPIVRRPWLFAQRWENMLFAHWRASAQALRRLLPARVEPDVHDGSGWIGIVAFVMAATRVCGAPAQSTLPPTAELNVRTYVRADGVPGVWFLSLDCSNPLFVVVGRALYGLRYRLARMAAAADGDRVHYVSTRVGASFAATYAPKTAPTAASPGSLEEFLFERYRLFADRRGRAVTAEVDHEPWQLQRAHATIGINSMAPAGLTFDGAPLLHFVPGIDARISAPLALEQRASRGRRRPYSASRATG